MLGELAPFDAPRVSVWMITYNQERYIEEAVRSVLAQEVNFDVEIVIGEDCSTDGTREILLRLQAIYPTRIRLLLNDKNVGMIANQNLTFRECRGEFIAMLEGDDYWSDSSKLEKQVAALESHPGSDICFHPVEVVGKKRLMSNHSSQPCMFSMSDVIKGGGYFCPTPSLMLRRNVVGGWPDFLDSAPAGDYYLQMLGAVRGGAVYLPDVMAAYRLDAVGSWSLSIKVFEKKQSFRLRTLDMLDKMDHFFCFAYSKPISEKKFEVALMVAFDYLYHGRSEEFSACYKLVQGMSAKRTYHYHVVNILRFFPSILRTIYFGLKLCRNARMR